MHSLNMLARQRIPKARVTLFVANESERKAYRKALQGSEWADVRIAPWNMLKVEKIMRSPWFSLDFPLKIGHFSWFSLFFPLEIGGFSWFSVGFLCLLG